jgi:hypothetical protein
LTGEHDKAKNHLADRTNAMTVIDYKESIRWETQLPVAEDKLLVTEEFVSVATPVDRHLGSSIVDEFAEDLRRLADA